MSYKITYILIRFGVVPNQGLTLAGKNGRVYGHMVYEKKYGGHVLRMPQADWEGGADENILKRTNRAAAVIRVRVEVDVDEESREGQLEQELDLKKTRIQELEAEVAHVSRHRDAVAADLATIKTMMTAAPLPQLDTPPPAPAETALTAADFPNGVPTVPPTHDELKAAIDAHGASTAPAGLTGDGKTGDEQWSAADAQIATGQQGAEKDAVEQLRSEVEPGSLAQGALDRAIDLSPSGGHAAGEQEGQEPPPEPADPVQSEAEALDAHKARLEEMGYPAMMEEAKELNATANAGIDTTIRTKLGIRAVLVAWYEKHPH